MVSLSFELIQRNNRNYQYLRLDSLRANRVKLKLDLEVRLIWRVRLLLEIIVQIAIMHAYWQLEDVEHLASATAGVQS